LNTRRWQYRISNKEVEGIGTVEFEGTFTPEVVFAGATTTPSYTLQQGFYTRRGDICTITVRLEFSYTGTVSANQFRITGIPYDTSSTTNETFYGVLGLWASPFTVPAGATQVSVAALAGVDYLVFDAAVSGGSRVIISSDEIPVSSGHRFEFTLAYKVADEALN